MSQFDMIIVFPIILPLLVVLISYYSVNITYSLPTFFVSKKFRFKRLTPLTLVNLKGISI